jgi:ethanolamine transporter EutH
MEFKTAKIVTLFFIFGLSFGLVTAFSAFITPFIIWFGAGATFLLGLAASVITARIIGWIFLPATTWRYLIASLLITGAYPVAFAVMLIGATGYNWVYWTIAPEKWKRRSNLGNFPDVDEGFFIGLALAAITSAVLVSLALWVITRKWDRESLALLVIAGIATIPLSSIIAALMEIWNSLLVLFPVGEALFGALCGYWLQRATKEYMITTLSDKVIDRSRASWLRRVP